MRDHRKLKAFELADQLAIATYRATESLPPSERFGLCAQMRRAAVSVATNIVEGCARESQRNFVHFLTVAFGSLRELGYLCDLAYRLDYIDAERFDQLQQIQQHCAATLGALIQSLRK